MSIFRTKSVEDVLANSHIDSHGDPVPGKGHLAKNLTAWDLMGFGIGIVIGTGIFTLTGLQAKNQRRPGDHDLVPDRRLRQPAGRALLRRARLRGPGGR